VAPPETPASAPSGLRLRNLAWLAAIAWTVFLGGALAYRLRDVRLETHQSALAVARAHFNKDQVFRLWAAQRGGVYVPIDEHTQPSPYLENVPDRDIAVADGKRLTLMDPANLVRQLAANYPELYGVTGHVTSLEPLRPGNAPDAWERTALLVLAGGASEVADFVTEGGEPQLRLMRPMVTREDCLKCHVDQADHVGEARGGVSVSVPMAPLYAAERPGHRRALWILGPTWLVGIGGIVFSGRTIGAQAARRLQAVGELQRAHDLLREERDVYRTGPVVVFKCRDEAGWPLEYISDNVSQVLGHELAAFAAGSLTLGRLVHPDDLARLTAAAAGEAAPPGRFGHQLYRFRHHDGHDLWVLANVVTQGCGQDGVARIQGYFVDITGWQRTESALRESEDRLDLALGGAELGVWDWDLVTNKVVFDERWASMLGYPLHEIEPTLKAWEERVHPEDLPKIMVVLTDHLEGRTPIYRSEFRMRARNGDWVWMLDTGKVIERDKEGRPLRAVGVHQDITARRNAEAAREMALERFHALIDNLQMGVLVESSERTIVEVNRAFCTMFGVPDPGLLMGMDCGRAAGGAAALFTDADGFTARLEAILAGAEVVVNEELSLNDGRTFERDYVPINVRGRLIGNMWIYRDVTRRKRLEKEAVQQERLAAVGQLSAGIAHDFNNILCSIMGFTELIQADPETAPSLQTNLRRIGDSSRRAAHLVRQILDFSQKTMHRLQPVDLEACVRDAAGLLRAALPGNIDVVVQVEPGSYRLDSEPSQMHQMVTNLAINARDAMPGGGELSLRLSRGMVDDPSVNCSICGQAIAGQWLRLEVADTGTGIEANVLPHIFEPFFTTKKVGEGTGLGLSQAAGIAAQHGGHVTVRSTCGRGTSFHFYLPPALDREQVRPEAAAGVALGSGESVLLVEDEPSVREAIEAMLRHLGYAVTVAASGREALDLYAERGARFSLVLTDVVMPDIDGEALCAKLRALDPGVRIVAMSGYPLGTRGASLLERGVLAWVQKPMAIEQLASVVAAAVNGGCGGGDCGRTG